MKEKVAKVSQIGNVGIGVDINDDSYLRNCHVISKPGDRLLFGLGIKGGDARIFLDGYAIIPREEFYRLKNIEAEAEKQ